MYIGNSPFTKASYNNIEVLATEGQTAFNVSYQPNFIDVLVNGVELSKTDYVALNGTSVVLNKPLALNDVVVFKVWGTFQTADAVATRDVDQTIAGVKTFSSSPIVPTPTTGTQAVNKKYVDDALYLQPSIAGSITLNGTTDNTVDLADIVIELGLEIGDVIRIDTGAYNKLHTVESITNNNSIIVNYEHAGNRGNGSLKLPDAAGQATVTRIAKWFNAPIGLGQAWVNISNKRSVGSTYTNSSNRVISAYAGNWSVGGHRIAMRINGDVFGGNGSDSTNTTRGFLVGADLCSGDAYMFFDAIGTPIFWELR